MDQAELSKVVKEVLKQLGVGTPTNVTPEYYSIKDAAVVASLSPDHIRKAVVGGTLVASNVGTKDAPLYRISRKNLLLWLNEREAGAKPPPRKTSKVAPVSIHHKPKRQRSSDGNDQVN